MKFWMIVVFVFFGFVGIAQNIDVDGVIYKVKGDIILMDGKDVTETLTAEKKEEIIAAINVNNAELMKVKAAEVKAQQAAKAEQKARKQADKVNKAEEKAAKAEKKAIKEEEKAKKEMEKAQKEAKKAEKALKKKEKLQSNFVKVGEKHTNANLKYEKLKNKGKLSPVDEQKWIKKIDKLKSKLDKAKSKI